MLIAHSTTHTLHTTQLTPTTHTRNRFPGNEYWQGSYTASGDPAAACCSAITMLQNPDINPTRLSGEATYVYGPAATDVGALE